MDGNDWIQHILEQMQADINEIKSDVKEVKEFKLKIAGGVLVLSALITFAVNAIEIWVRHA